MALRNHFPLVVIGAGPAGLTAAHEAVGRGIQPIVLEKADKVGGLARTETYQGYRFDIGGHRFFTKIREVQALWEEVLGDDFQVVSRLSRIYHQGRFYNYPLEPSNALRNLGPVESARIVLSYAQCQLRRNGQEDNFEQWVTNRFGRRLYEIFFKTYTEKVWGMPCTEIRADWAAQRIKGLSLRSVVSNALFGYGSAKTLIKEFHYPVLGPGMMWQRFREIVEDRGGQVWTETKVVRLEQDGGRVVGVVVRRDRDESRLSADHVISSMPLPELLKRLDPPPPEEVIQAANGLRYRDFLLVGLIVNSPDPFPDNWIYVHDPEVRVGRIQNFAKWSAAMVPEAGKASLGMEYFCNEGDATWQTPDADLIDLATRELAELGLADAADVVDGLVIRQPKTYPVYDAEYHAHLAVIRRFLAAMDNLQTIGRNGLHRYNNMDHSMLTGMLALQNVLGADYDLWEVNEEEEYLERDTKAQAAQLIPDEVLIQTFARMDKLAFATAVGSVSGLLLFLATIWLVIKGGDVVGPNLKLLGQYFIGYTVTVKGAFVAFGYGFVWGFLFGWLFAYLRNLFLAVYIYRVKMKAELLSLGDFIESF